MNSQRYSDLGVNQQLSFSYFRTWSRFPVVPGRMIEKEREKERRNIYIYLYKEKILIEFHVDTQSNGGLFLNDSF